MYSSSERAKVSPVGVPSAKRNNYIYENNNVVRQFKYFIGIEAILGINRTYILNNKSILIISIFISFSLTILTVLFFAYDDIINATYLVFKDTICIEFILLTLIPLLQKSKLDKLFGKLSTFDKRLNIEKDINITNPMYDNLFWIFGSFAYFFFLEYLGLLLHASEYIRTLWGHLIYSACLAHDCEIIFFCVLLKTILRRLQIIRAHVTKTFSTSLKASSRSQSIKKLEALSENVKLDISSLHQVYELLHKCCEQLNSIMGYPLFIMFITSGLSTTLLLKYIIRLLQSDYRSSLVYSSILYASARSLKFTLLMIFPCYYASVTTMQVTFIRTVLHDAIVSLKYNKFDRRKIKAFIQLTRDNEFTYNMGGIIKLDMSLPLSYSSLCATYLVIIIQFSKFFD